MTWTLQLSRSLGASEDGLKLILGQLMAYPVFILYRLFLSYKAPRSIHHHLFFIATGISLAYWTIGIETLYHTLSCILITYGILFVGAGTLASCFTVLAFNMTYLVVGYCYTASEGYDVCWTMPHCVLCLRLTAIAIDLYDGHQPEEKLSASQKMTAMKEIPSLLEMLSQCFFIGGYFVGPQFSMRKYQAFIERNIQGPLSFGFKRLFIGLLYLGLYVVGSMKLPSDYVMKEEFHRMNFWPKQFWFAIWVKIILSKYIAAWLLAEGAVIISGLGYNGVDEDGQILWNGGANVRLRVFEKSSKFGHLIESFNINTNGWVSAYIYKRLKCFNNRYISQFLTLGFLALWHGLHSGYYLTFFNEFIIMYFEKDVESLLKRSQTVQHWLTHPAAEPLTWFFGKFYLTLMLPHCFLPFALLKWTKYYPVIKSVYGLPYLIFIPWPIFSILIKKTLKRKDKKQD